MARLKILRQFGNFAFEPKEIKNPNDRITGRYTGKGGGEQDDLCLAGQMPPYWRMVFLNSQNPDYIEFRERNRIETRYI
jgi:hypothetical protein